MTIEEWEELPWWKQDVYTEGINEHIKLQAKLAGAKFGNGDSDDVSESGNVPVTGDIASDPDIQIQRI